MAKSFFVGVDPGATGAVAILDRSGRLTRWVKFDRQCPIAGLEMALESLLDRSWGDFLLGVENVWAAPGQGVVSMFTFGRGLGRIEGWLKAHNITHESVAPQTWQKWLPEAEGGAKGRAKAGAEARWGLAPFVQDGCRVPHQGGIDAAGIAEYLRRLDQGELEAPAAPRKRMRRLRPIAF